MLTHGAVTRDQVERPGRHHTEWFQYSAASSSIRTVTDLRKVIALGSPTGEHRAAIEAAVRKAGVELSISRESSKALAEVEQSAALAVLVDMSALGAEHFCRKARANERLQRVPIIALSRNPSELSFNRIFTWGADDLVPLGAEAPLAARLTALGESLLASEAGFGQAVVAESNAERCALLGRALTQAGYDVKYAVDAASVESYASQSETRLVVLNAGITPPRKLIEAVEQAGALPIWVVTADPRNLGKIAQGLDGIARVVLTSSSASPEDILFVANELVFSRGGKRRESRALLGTPVLFRDAAGGGANEFGFSYDVSPNGLYVRSLLPCDFSEVSLELRPPRRDKTVSLRGQIVRRVRFGSGLIASAPPGFGVLLTGEPDDADFSAWVSACREFLSAPSPLADASGGALVIGAKDPTFKRLTPPPGPLPADLRARTGPPPAEPTPTPAPAPAAEPAVGSPLLAPDEIDEVLGMIEAPPKSQARDSMHSDVGQMLADTLESERVSSPGAVYPVTMTFDTKTVIEKPHSDVPPPEAELPKKEAEKPAAAMPVVAAAEAKAATPPAPPAAPAKAATPPAPPAAPAKAATPPAPPVAPPRAAPPAAPMKLPSAKTTLVMGAVVAPPAPVAKPPQPVSPTVAADMRRTAPATPPALARTQVAPPALARTQVAPPELAATLPSARQSPLTPSDQGNAPTEPAPPSTDDVAPVSIPKASPIPALVAAPLHAPAPVAPPLPAAAWASIAQSPNKPPPPPRAASSRGPIILAAVLGFAAVVGAVIAGFLLGLIPTGGASAQRGPKPERVATPTVVRSSTPIAIPAAPSATQAPARSVAPVAVSVAPAPSAAPAASAEPAAPAAPATEAPSAPPDVDLSALQPTQGYLFVRSSATSKVFVMGREIGDTNAPLVTGCGTRFVRIGPKLGHFIEPGGPVIIKCGALTEVTRQPK